jgi:hypothetical protein
MRITLILGSFEKSFMPSVGTGMGVEDALADMLGQAPVPNPIYDHVGKKRVDTAAKSTEGQFGNWNQGGY